MPDSINLPLRSLCGIVWGPTRRREPVTVGIPFPRSALTDVGSLCLEGPGGLCPTQVRTLDSWPDGSVRWALVDSVVDADDGIAADYVLRTVSKPPAANGPLRIAKLSNGLEISTGRATFRFDLGGVFPFSGVVLEGSDTFDSRTDASGFQIDYEGQLWHFAISALQVREEGPLRAEVEVRGTAAGALGKFPLEVWARVEVFAGAATLRMDLTLQNPRRAEHDSGQWPLGDPGSVLFRSSKLLFNLNNPVTGVKCAPEFGSALVDVASPFEIHQESSGGDAWNNAVHKNRESVVPLRFRGYRLRSGDRESFANRASPIVAVDCADGQMAVAVPRFWQNFPQSIRVTESAIEVGLFAEASDLHELQGGEQKSHRVVLAFARDTVSEPALAWAHDPQLLYPTPEWSCATEALPFLVPAAEDPHLDYLALVNIALDPADGFIAKRERADEYGWRNFGDLPADHESAFQPVDRPFVSHYNNQYDAIAGFAIHFLRTGDARWWHLCDDLARHVRDIDIYHTQKDKAAYNGGLFWHTNHYVDADTSTHRTYPRGGHESGGPASEHNYNAGLMLHFFLTGDTASRDGAIGLAQWVIRMDDGRQTPFRWLAGGATGLASASGTATYHGPGRGAANSILACLVAHQLTGEMVYLAKAEELIQRCVHPQEDLEALDLLDVERRWFYTVFLQTLGLYLHAKAEREDYDALFSYAQVSLLRYASWMAKNERPYLSRSEILEHKTETWAAQDMRKADVFLWAAMHARGEEQETFLERADFFFRYSVNTLSSMPGRRFTRPIVLMLSNGVRYGWLARQMRAFAFSVEPVRPDPRPRRVFEPQKARAIRRAKGLAAVAIIIVISLGLALAVL